MEILTLAAKILAGNRRDPLEVAAAAARESTDMDILNIQKEERRKKKKKKRRKEGNRGIQPQDLLPTERRVKDIINNEGEPVFHRRMLPELVTARPRPPGRQKKKKKKTQIKERKKTRAKGQRKDDKGGRCITIMITITTITIKKKKK